MHGEQSGPPQSISVSLPLVTPSEQLGESQVPPLQSRELQSIARLHPSPGEQGEQRPPQSTSVSVPFSRPSEQVGAWQVPPSHNPL
jgi:hypothetical protein